MKCPHCGLEIPVEETGRHPCPQCGFLNPEGHKFCGECGSSLTAATADQAERRQLTVLFCDLAGSTDLSAALDPEELRELVGGYQKVCGEVIARGGGYIAQYLGDGILAYFGFPHAQEDDARRAVRSALGIVDAMARWNERLEAERGLRLGVRQGIHTGPVVIGDVGTGVSQETLAIGETPNVAARLQGLASLDAVVLSETTYGLVRGFFTLKPLGPQRLKGIDHPVEVYEAHSESGVVSRFELAVEGGLLPLIGRREELDLLKGLWDEVRSGASRSVVIRGGPGIGKSRLVHALLETLPRQAHSYWTCRGSVYSKDSPFSPVIDFFRRFLAFQRGEAPGSRLCKLEAGLERFPELRGEALPILAALLSLPVEPPLALTPQRQKKRTLEVILAILRQLAEERRLLFFLEDLQWVDASTFELVERMLGGELPRGALTVLTTREELPFKAPEELREIVLGPLSEDEVKAMIAELASGKPLPDAIQTQIVAKTDGVAMFVEELTRTVLESDLLRGFDGHHATGTWPLFAIPSTLQGSLMARLDRLGTAKEVAQLASVVGREFVAELLQAVAGQASSDLEQDLLRLVDVDVLTRLDTAPESYSFRQTMLREAAYASLLKRTRRELHAKVAEYLVKEGGEVAKTQPEIVAFHFTEAGVAALAVEHWLRAGRLASERFANREAANHFRKGLRVLETLPETPGRDRQELELRIGHGAALIAVRGFAAKEVEETWARAYELCRQEEGGPEIFPVLWGLWQFYVSTSKTQRTRELAQRLLQIAEGEESLRPTAHRAMGESHHFLGELVDSVAHFDKGLAVSRRIELPAHARYGSDPGVVCASAASWPLWLLGYPEMAAARLDEGVELARKLGDPFSLAHALACGVVYYKLRRDAEATRETSQETLALATPHGFPFWVSVASIHRGWALAELGEIEEGVETLRQALAAHDQLSPNDVMRPFFFSLLAEALVKVDRNDEALHLVEDLLAFCERLGGHFYRPELHRLRGTLLDQEAQPLEEVEACFRRALETSRAMDAKSLELRAASSCARFLEREGRRQEARELLSPVYGWFTEGLDTRDLREAGELLDGLKP